MIAGISSILSPLENILRHVLVWLHESVGFSWAWSIVALTVIVHILLVPLTVRQIHSMQGLQVHAPEMKAIQQKWKHDKPRQNEELMKFYKENKINPAASCLPLVAQFPVFISLYLVLKHFDRVCAACTGTSPSPQTEWLHLVHITDKVSAGWGPLLLVIYVLSQLSSSWFMSTTMQGAQRWMMMILPIAFVPFLIHFKVGLMVYWLTTNLWTTGQGVVTRRMVPKPAPPPKRSSRTAAADAPPPAATQTKGANAAAKSKLQANGGKPIAGPPRRVKRKRSGGR